MRSNSLLSVCPLVAVVCVCWSNVGLTDEAAPKSDSKNEIEAKLAGRSPDEIRTVLDQFGQEWIARKGAVEVAYQRFKQTVDEHNKALKRFPT